MCPAATAQTVEHIDIRTAAAQTQPSQLHMGGKDPRGNSIGFTSLYMEQNSKPVVPVIGEFHYVRYPHEYWDESLKKMKAGGVSIVATYVFWNVHEQVEGQFDWSGDRDLRRFIDLCGKNDLQAIVRIGPFCHGEIRNGGLPDWLYGRPFNIRSNDAPYVRYVERLYREIGKQLDGLLFKNGGPVIGIQLENELQHSAAPWAFSYPGQAPEWTVADQDRYLVLDGVGSQKKGNSFAEEGRNHMAALKDLAFKAGLDVPLYTATGWGNASVLDEGTIPVTSAYPYPTWSKPAPSPLYLYKDLRTHPDYEPVSYDPRKYPSFGAELGGGIMVTYTRRPTISPRSLEALIMRELGSGANAIGYYMFHGGATPRGLQSYLSDEASGVPKISYDFQAPIGQYGQLGGSYRYLKLIHYFLGDFGSQLAPMLTVLPDSAAAIKPSDADQLRFAMRSRGDSGFLFLHNFQDHVTTRDLSNLELAIRTSAEEIRVPHSGTLTVKSATSAILPVNIDFGPVRVRYATAQPLCRLSVGKNSCYAFISLDGIEPEFALDGKTARNVKGDCRVTSDANVCHIHCDGDGVKEFTIDAGTDARTTFVVLPKSLALRAWLVDTSEGKRLLFSDATVLAKAGGLELHSHDDNKFLLSVYPALHKPPERAGKPLEEAPAPHPSMSAYRMTLPEIEPFVHAKLADRKTLTLKTEKTALPEGINDVFLEIDYTADVGMAFIKGELVDDHFYFGQPWRIGLKRFLPKLAEDEMYISFRPIAKDAPFIADLPAAAVPDFSKQNDVLRINHVRVAPEYRVELGL
jgi:hypothetical protein